MRLCLGAGTLAPEWEKRLWRLEATGMFTVKSQSLGSYETHEIRLGKQDDLSRCLQSVREV